MDQTVLMIQLQMSRLALDTAQSPIRGKIPAAPDLDDPVLRDIHLHLQGALKGAITAVGIKTTSSRFPARNRRLHGKRHLIFLTSNDRLYKSKTYTKLTTALPTQKNFSQNNKTVERIQMADIRTISGDLVRILLEMNEPSLQKCRNRVTLLKPICDFKGF